MPFSPTPLRLAALLCLTLPLSAQISSSQLLPDSPSSTLSHGPYLGDTTSDPDSAGFGQSLGRHTMPVASTADKYIEPGQKAPPLTSRDKVKLGFRDAVSPFAAIGWLASASYSQAIDSSPNYGQGWRPFGQRLGAAAARSFSEDVFSDAVFSPLYHEDPRYYRLGPTRNFFVRTAYSVTRTIVTRTDSGRLSPNLALISGNAAGAILTNAYYPQQNRNASGTVQTFATSMGGSAIGFFISEFLSDTLGIVHLSKTR